MGALPLCLMKPQRWKQGTAPALFGRARSTHSGWSPSWDQGCLFSIWLKAANALFNLLEFFLGFWPAFPASFLNDLGGCFGHKPFVGELLRMTNSMSFSQEAFSLARRASSFPVDQLIHGDKHPGGVGDHL